MKSGSYDQKINFKSFQNISDGFGGTVPNFVNLITTFAAVKITKAFNITEAGQMELPLIYTFRIQYRNSFIPTVAMRITYKDKDIQIKSIQENDERQHREYIITGSTL
jgi:SPP1 family predicted phage head-tail adaptor